MMNITEVENGSLFGLEDLAQESPYVRQELFAYLVKTNNMGFDGYRWDAAKHVPKWFWKDHILNNVNAWGKYNFGEVVESDLDRLQGYVDTGMAVTDQSLLYDNGGQLKFGESWPRWGAGYAARNGEKALTFVENHDYGPPSNRQLAYAFISAYPGYPSFYNVLLDDSAINNLIWVHENLAIEGAVHQSLQKRNTIIFERTGHLLAGINQSETRTYRWVQTSWRNTKLHDYSFHVEDKWTNNDGYVEVWIPPMSYVMLAPR